MRRMFMTTENPIVTKSQKTLTQRGPLIVNRKGAKIRVVKLRLITPEHDQSIVTQCRVYGGYGEISVCHKSVRIVTIETTRAKVLTGEGILRKMFKMSIRHARTITTIITAENGMDCEFRGISKVGPFAGLPQINSL